jgi:hypothetical protein
LIDVGNHGWHFTNPNESNGYVTFRFGATLQKVSWPDWKFDNAWLVYDKNGVIDGADNLFGSYTQHSNGDFLAVKADYNPNGFLALAFYDQPAQGGNMDGVIDNKDKIYKYLRLWKPKHCHLHPDQPCVALDNELFKLESQGVHSISVAYSAADEKDAVGNTCNFKSMVNTEKAHPQKSKDGRWACDFNLVVKGQ